MCNQSNSHTNSSLIFARTQVNWTRCLSIRGTLLSAIVALFSGCSQQKRIDQTVEAIKEFGGTIERDENFRVYLVRVSDKPVTPIGLKHIASLPDLRALVLTNAQISNEDLKILSQLANLKFLNLYGNDEITNDGLSEVLKFKKLTGLVLAKTKITDVGLEYLSSLRNMEDLTLWLTNITDEGLVHLKHSTSLKKLNLGSTGITGAGLKEFKGLTSLVELNLSGTRVDDNGMKHLQSLTNLENLDIRVTDVTDAGLKFLANLPNLKNLKVSGYDITDAALKSFQKAMPNCEIDSKMLLR